MMISLQSLLSQPLMISPASLPALFAESLSEPTGPPPVKQPTVSLALYGMDGSQVKQSDKRPEGSLVGVVSISGPMSRHGYSGFFSSSPGMLETGRTIQRLANDPSIYAIILSFDSPGGSVTGTFELAETVFQIRGGGQPKIVSVADSMMASAAMAVGAAASEVYAIPSATVGSIGVLSAYSSYSEFMQKQGIETTIVRSTPLKARFSGIEPLSDAMLSTMQKSVNEMHGEFVGAMAKYRGVSPRHVEKRFGQGEVLRTNEAIDAGLIDAVGSVDEVLSLLVREAATNRRTRV